MLLTVAPRPFTANGWLFEPKFDGFRCLARKRGAEIELISRGNKPLHRPFPEIVAALAAVPDGVYDGELVVPDEHGHPHFGRLSSRHRIARPSYVAAAAREHPATLCVFDVLVAEERDFRGEPLLVRKEWLQQHLPGEARLMVVNGVEAHGHALFAEACRQNLEGIVGKRLDSRYYRGRTQHWVKIKHPGYVRGTQ